MILSIITINRNNAAGLEKTLQSVAAQTYKEFEYIVVDGASTDNSVEVIQRYAPKFSHLMWVSEPDNGIYNAMNKGICMASGEYIQILNSGDMFASDGVVKQMFVALDKTRKPGILYGNMIRQRRDGTIEGKSGEVEYSLLNYYRSTLNHDCCWIKKSLFGEYGMYNENLRVVSDWEWWIKAIGLGKEKPVYVDVDVTIFDTTGISETNMNLRNEERRKVLESLVPPAILADYDKHAFDMIQMDHLRKHKWAYKLVWLLERMLNKF